MKIFFVFLIFSTNLFSKLTFEEIDLIRSYSDVDAKSIIQNGTSFCNDYFKRNFSSSELNYQNSFICKFSKKRNRFYVYMLAIDKRDSKSLKKFCSDILVSWPDIYEHVDRNFKFQKIDYLSGFYIENFFYDKVIDFSDKYKEDQRIISNELNNYILKNRNNFSNNNEENNLIIEKEIKKINKIYKKIISGTKTDLDTLIDQILADIVRYKIFVNDVANFKSYSCNWIPGKDKDPYVKREKFSEFENI
tara:strand:+ start:7890 stop:8633 length:744 start_codon:yes stop_codon:yes gene_type:complete